MKMPNLPRSKKPQQQPLPQQPMQQGSPMPSSQMPGQPPIFQQAPQAPRSSASAMEARVQRLSRAATASIVAAALGVTFGIYSLVSTNAQIAQTKEGMTNVVVATQQIDAGTAITEDKLEVKEVPQAYVSSGAVSKAEDFVGQVALTRIDQGTQLTSSVIAAAKDSSSLAAALTPGYKAVTISVDEVQGYSGLLKVGDTVDVLSNESSLNGGTGTLSRITGSAMVIALGSSLADSDGSYSTVTVEVTPNEADAIRTAQANGSVSLELHPTAPSQE